MRLRTQIIIEAAAFLLLALIIGGLVITVSFWTRSALSDANNAARLEQDFFQLSVLRNDFVMYRGERARDQWVAKQVSLQKKLRSLKMGTPSGNEEVEYIAGLMDNVRATSVLLLGLPPSDTPGLGSGQGTELEQYYVTVLLERNAQVITQIAGLSRSTGQRLVSLHNTTTALVGVFIVATAGILLMFAWTVFSSVLKPVSELEAGANRIGSGELDYRVPEGRRDEIGALAASFNGMAADLKESYEELTDEIATRRKAEEEVREHRDKLEEKVRERTAELEEAMEDLSRSNAELEQFAYVASHDLQEPLRMVASYTELIKQKYRGRMGDEADEFIDYAVDGAVRMQQLINDLLTYSRVGSHGTAFEPVDMNEVYRKTVLNLKASIDEKNAIVTRGDLPVIQADAAQMTQLLQNLIANAIKFNKETLPRVEVTGTRKENDWLFAVEDNGIGVEPRYAERIFRIFHRLHGHGKYKGTGIGLALCQRIVERHGGRIWVESDPARRQGSTFYFTIPERGGSEHVRKHP